MEKLITTILLTLTIWSCGSVKKHKTEAKEEVKIESVETVKDSSITNVAIKEDTEEVTYTPVDLNKPMVIDDKSFINVVVKKVKKKVETSLKKVNNIKGEKVAVITIKKEVETKDVDREESYSWIIWILLAIAAAYFYLKK